MRGVRPAAFQQWRTVPGVLLLLLLHCSVAFDLDFLLQMTARQAEERVDQMLSRCYGDFGCFSLGGKFVSMARPVNLFPYSVETLATTLHLYTREHPNLPQDLIASDLDSINETSFNFSQPTKFIVHGFLEGGTHTWCIAMKDEFLVHDDYNVVIVDWLVGALPPYTQAVANARLVGAIVARFLELLRTLHQYPPGLSHVVGHSLGAHVAGYIGQRMSGLGRISGLDPAGPYFENTDPVVRLDPTDAVFVDVIHTDGASLLSRAFGLSHAIGHVDFYPNGGIKQPGCEETVTEALEREDMNIYRGFRHWVACRHVRAHEYFTESINSRCSFRAHQCGSHEAFARGLCANCGRDGRACARMGYHAQEYAALRRSNQQQSVRFFLNTNSQPPYCTNHHVVTLHTARQSKTSLVDDQLTGVMLLQIDWDKRRSELIEFNSQEKTFEPDMAYSVVVSSRIGGAPRRVHLHMLQPHGLTNQLARIFKGDSTLGFDSVEVEDLDTGQITELCGGTNKILKGDSKVTLYPRAKC